MSKRISHKEHKKEVFNRLLDELMSYKHSNKVDCGGYALSTWCAGGSDRVRAFWTKRYRYALNK